MAQATITATIKWRWWFRSYLSGVQLMTWLTGCEPNRERVLYWVGKGIKVEIRNERKV